MAGNDIILQLGLASLSNSDLNKIKSQLENTFKNYNIPVNIQSAKATAQIGKITSATNAATVATEKFGVSIGRTAQRFSAYAVASTAVITLSNAIGNATDNALKFEYELAKIAQTINASNKEVRLYTPQILNISKAYGLSNTKIAQTVRILTQAGLSFKEAIKGAETLSKTTLLASFDNLNSSTEAFIATMSTFNLTVNETKSVFEAINVVSKKYAVESDDLVEAIKRTGGVFAATGGNAKELIALFSSVRSTTRETADTIATGFRTIFSRLQRPKTIEFFRNLNVELEDAQGNFVGNYAAIENISKGLDRLGIRAGSIQFAQVVEEIGGLRQVSRVIPLLTQMAKTTAILDEAQRGANETDKDVIKSKETLAFKIQELQQNFENLFVEISQSDQFQLMAKTLISVANAAVETARAIKPLIPLIAILASYKIGRGIAEVIRSVPIGGVKGVSGYAGGGVVPGRGDGDTVPAMLTPGEFVVSKARAKAFGYDNLKKINKYAKGGVVGYSGGGEVEKSFDRGVGDPTINLSEAQGIATKFIDSFVDIIDDLNQHMNSKILDIKEYPEPIRNSIKGVFSGKGGTPQSYIRPNEANVQVLKHEIGHNVDYALGKTSGLSQPASKETGTFQNEITNKLKPILESILDKELLTEEQVQYRLKNQEIFADLIANTTDEARKILVSTTDSAKGMQELAELIHQSQTPIVGLAGLKPTDLVPNFHLHKALDNEELDAPKDIVEEWFPIEKQKKTTTSTKQPVSQRTPNEGFLGNSGINTPPINPFTFGPNPLGGGGGGNRDRGSVLGSGAAGNPLPKLNEENKEVTKDFTGLAIAIALGAQSINQLTQNVDGSSSALSRVTEKLASLATITSTAIAGLNTFGIKLNTKIFTNALSGKSGSNFLGFSRSQLTQRPVPFKKSPLSLVNVTFTKPVITPPRSAAAALSGKLGVAGGALATGALAGLLTQQIGELIDAFQGLTELKEAAIKEGKVTEASSLALTERLNKDLNILSGGIVGATVAIAAFTGPLAPFVTGIGLATVAFLKFTETGQIVAKRLRDFAADLGLADSNALIEAQSRAAAAANAFTRIMESSGERIKVSVGNITSADPTKRQNATQIANSGDVREVFSSLEAQLKESANLRRQATNDVSSNLSGGTYSFRNIFGEVNDLLAGAGITTSRQANSDKVFKANEDSQKADKDAVKSAVNSIQPVLEKLALDFTKSGGTKPEKFAENLEKVAPDLFKQLKNTGAQGQLAIDTALSQANIKTTFGNFIDALEAASKAALDLDQSLHESSLGQISRNFDVQSLSPRSGIGDIRSRNNSLSQLLTDTGVSGASLLKNTRSFETLNAKPKDARSDIEERQLSGLKAAIDTDTQNIKQNIDVRKALIDGIKQEIAIENERRSVISASLGTLALGDRAQKRQLRDTLITAQLLQNGQNVGTLSRKQRGLVTEAQKFLTKDDQERVQREIEAAGAKEATKFGLKGNLGASFKEVGATGSTRALDVGIARVSEQNQSIAFDEKQLNQAQAQQATILSEEFNRISKEFQKVLNDGKLAENIDKLVNIKSFNIEFPTNFTVDLTNTNDLLAVIKDQVMKEVAKGIEGLKNGE